MALRKILIHPDPRLKKAAAPVLSVNDEIRRLADDMLETMYEENGIGLAASQVDFHERIIVIDISEERNDPKEDWPNGMTSSQTDNLNT